MKANKKQVNSSPAPTTNQELDHFTKTPEARAMFNRPRKVNNNIKGINQYSIVNNFVPYPLKYAIADALLKDGKTINYVINYTGLSRDVVFKLKNGDIKLQSRVAERVKEHEQENLVFLGNSILDRISEDDVQKASLSQKVISYSILLDKRRLLAGESTENVNHLAKLDVLVNSAKRADNMLDKLESVDNK